MVWPTEYDNTSDEVVWSEVFWFIIVDQFFFFRFFGSSFYWILNILHSILYLFVCECSVCCVFSSSFLPFAFFRFFSLSPSSFFRVFFLLNYFICDFFHFSNHVSFTFFVYIHSTYITRVYIDICVFSFPFAFVWLLLYNVSSCR